MVTSLGVGGGSGAPQGFAAADALRMSLVEMARVPVLSELRCLLFDLDGTLLDIDGEQFLDDYVAAMAPYFRPWADPEAFQRAVMAASVPIFSEHPDRTNGEVFRAHLASRLGVEESTVNEQIQRFHREALAGLAIPRGPVPAARPCVEAALARGYQVAVATTPIYLPEVVMLRLRWAGLDDLPWALITHSENMHTCKPDVAYFQEAAAILGVQPTQCLMIGDDRLQDMPAAQCGMHVYWTKASAQTRDVWGGQLSELTEFLRQAG